MRTLFIGGTPFVGLHAVRAALARGHEVTLFNRGSIRQAFSDVEQLIGDRDTLEWRLANGGELAAGPSPEREAALLDALQRQGGTP